MVLNLLMWAVVQIRVFVRSIDGETKQEINQSPVEFMESCIQPQVCPCLGSVTAPDAAPC